MDRHRALWSGFVTVIAASIVACSGPAAPSVTPTGAAPSPASVPSVAPETAAPTEVVAPSDSPAPSRSHKPLPSIDPAELDAYLTSSITLLDLADGDLSVAVTYVDPSTSNPIDFGTYDLAATEQLTDQVPPGTYRLLFQLPDGTGLPTCTIDVGEKDAYAFAAIPGAVAVSKGGSKPTTADELFVSTSSLCGH